MTLTGIITYFVSYLYELKLQYKSTLPKPTSKASTYAKKMKEMLLQWDPIGDYDAYKAKKKRERRQRKILIVSY